MSVMIFPTNHRKACRANVCVQKAYVALSEVAGQQAVQIRYLRTGVIATHHALYSDASINVLKRRDVISVTFNGVNREEKQGT